MIAAVHRQLLLPNPPYLGRRGALHRAPAGDAALATLHQRQVQGGTSGFKSSEWRSIVGAGSVLA